MVERQAVCWGEEARESQTHLITACFPVANPVLELELTWLEGLAHMVQHLPPGPCPQAAAP